MKRVKTCWKCGCKFICSMTFAIGCGNKTNCFCINCRRDRTTPEWISGEICDIKIVRRGTK